MRARGELMNSAPFDGCVVVDDCGDSLWVMAEGEVSLVLGAGVG